MHSAYSKLGFIVFALLAISVSAYPMMYFVVDRTFGLLGDKPPQLLEQLMYNVGFYCHILLGSVALLVGWPQFHAGWRSRSIKLHRTLGKIYIVAVLFSGLGSLYIVTYGSGGLVAQAGFFCLAVTWLSTTYVGYRAVKLGDISRHQRMMVYSYAACFAAVMLRIWLPLFTSVLDWGFTPSYRVIAWLCWVPNMAVAYWINSRRIAG